jgi:nitroreductase
VDGVGRPITGHAAVRNIGTVPAIILVFWNPARGVRMKNEYRQKEDGAYEEVRPSQGRGSSLFPACQNMMVAAKALGLGSLFTTFLRLREGDIKRLLHVPPQMFLEAGIFIGYPAEKLGRPRRRPIEEVGHDNLWERVYRPVEPSPAAGPRPRA